MDITPSLLKTIRNKYDKDLSETKKEFDTYLCDEIKRMKDIRAKVIRKENEIHKKETDFQMFRLDKIKEIKEIETLCGHEVVTYHPDPSGNNDSYIECEICGKEAKRL